MGWGCVGFWGGSSIIGVVNQFRRLGVHARWDGVDDMRSRPHESEDDRRPPIRLRFGGIHVGSWAVYLVGGGGELWVVRPLLGGAG